jgi:hypothetical protein
MGGTCDTHGGGERRSGLLVGRPKGMRPLGRPRLGGRITLRWTLER